MNLGIAKHIGNKIGRFRDMETDDVGRALMEQIRLHRPILVFLSETKCKTRRVDHLKERLNYNSIGVDSHGKGDGLMLLWWKDIEVWLQSYSEHPIDATVSGKGNVARWHFSGFYSHPETSKRKGTWDLL
ncbi:hypothetical protein Sango_2643800 [Sesamum angolense]|uniref:Uncharacterized protein n=1 Tax=Sesamum angolense TaxID=2727404 RepID=A0AAE1W1W9_9LAMI|nr:hypothetical protein Sango_2643800 [Sesamum angolense]